MKDYPELNFLQRDHIYLNKRIHLKVGTDCSGIETPIMTLRLLSQLSNGKISFSHLFASEIDSKIISFIENNFKPNVIYKDLTTRDNNDIPRLDLYIAGFPCQSFSNSGTQLGFNDEKKGQIFFYIHDFIKKNKPRVFVLENVKNLVHHDRGNTWKTIIDMLNKLPYKIYFKVLNTLDYGLPQSRTRIYIVGVHNSIKREFAFPEKVDIKNSIDNLLYDKRKYNTVLSHREQTALDGMLINDQKLKSMPNENWVINLDVSDYTRGRRYIGYSPCLYTRCKYYLLKYGRHITPKEALRLQGVTYELYDWSMFTAENQIYSVAGNAMSINVLYYLFLKILNLY